MRRLTICVVKHVNELRLSFGTVPQGEVMSKADIIFLTKLTAAQIEKGEDLPPRLISIGKEVEAKVSKFQTYETKATDMAVSIKQLLAEAATYCDKGGFNAFRKHHCPSLGRSRTYELLAIASGKKKQKQSKAEGAARQGKHLAKLKKLAASVSDGPSSALRQFTASVLKLVLLTATEKPSKFAGTTAKPDDLKMLGKFLMTVADLHNDAQNVVSLQRRRMT